MKLLINGRDETNRIGNIIRSDHVDGLAMSLSFDVAFNSDDGYWSREEIATGDKVVFANDAGKVVFAGMITSINQRSKYVKNYTAYDYGWHLNKNAVAVQFRKLSADAAITKLCNDFGIPIGSICSMPTKISKIYNDEILSNCIKDIIRQAEVDAAESYRMEVRENKLYIEPYGNLIIQTSFKPASNIAPFDPMQYPSAENYTESIDNMVNMVRVVSANEQVLQIVGEAKDNVSTERYGTLQLVEQLNDKDRAQARNIAKNLLLERNKITKELSVVFLGDDAVRSGRIVIYQERPRLIKECTHNYNGAAHTMTLVLEEI